MTDESASDDPTVERYDPQAHPDTMMAAEHLARYRWARQFVQGRRVLDAGSGTGFGALMLAEAGAAHVVGIDNDAPAVEQASAGCSHNIEFTVGDVAAIPFGDASFDVVTCMEVIEHVEDPERVLDELQRVLKPDGLLLLSTPNRDVVVPGNRFHVHEFTPHELTETLSARFHNVAVRRQHTWVATGVMDDATLSGGSGSIEGAELHGPPAAIAGEELTTLAVASDGEIPTDRIVVEISEPVELRAIDRAFHDQRHLIEDQRNAIENHVLHEKDLRTEQAKLRAALVDAETELRRMIELESELQETTVLAEHLREIERQSRDVDQRSRDVDQRSRDVEQESREVERKFRESQHETEQLKAVVDSLLNSTSWRVTSPMRRVMAFVRSLIRAR